ncbi:MAG: hypothetical protein AAGA18_00595 [Verrucomicrobiota bacterium]
MYISKLYLPLILLAFATPVCLNAYEISLKKSIVTPPAHENELYMETFVRYKNDINNAVAKTWREEVTKHRGSLKPGVVAFRYFINPYGRISLIEQDRGDKDSLLTLLSYRSIVLLDKTPLTFPENMRKELPGGFFHSVAFRIDPFDAR